MSYKKPIKVKDKFLVYSRGKPKAFKVTEYRCQDSDDYQNEYIKGRVLPNGIDEFFSRSRIICKLNPEDFPEYFI